MLFYRSGARNRLRSEMVLPHASNLRHQHRYQGNTPTAPRSGPRMHIPAKPITDSGASRSPFRAKPITDSGASRSPFRQADHFWHPCGRRFTPTPTRRITAMPWHPLRLFSEGRVHGLYEGINAQDTRASYGCTTAQPYLTGRLPAA